MADQVLLEQTRRELNEKLRNFLFKPEAVDPDGPLVPMAARASHRYAELGFQPRPFSERL